MNRLPKKHMKSFSSGSPVTCYGLIGGLIILLVARYCSSGGVYIDWHLNADVGGPYLKTFYPTNDKLGKTTVSQNKIVKARETQDEEFMSGLQALKEIVNQAANDGKRLRAYGSRWTVTNMPYTSDYMIDTYGLNYAKIGIDNDDDVLNDYKGERKDRLVFTQCGVMVKYMYKILHANGLALSTTSTTDGATMAGAISTGTHDSAVLFGSMTEYVKGIHLVIPGKTVYVQRSSDPVLTEDYVINTLGADELQNSDDMFNAALVSFGCFGVIHGYLIEAEKLFRLKVEVINLPFSESKDAMFSLEPDKIAALGFDLGNPAVLPWFIQVALNPLQLEQKKGSRVRVMHKIPLSQQEIEQVKAVGASYEPPPNNEYQLDVGTIEKMLAFTQLFGHGLVGNTIRRFIFGTFNTFFTVYLFGVAGVGGEGYPIDLYTQKGSDSYFVNPPMPTTTMELGMPLDDLEEAVGLIMEIMNDFPSPTVIDLRFTAKSNATLSAAKFDPIINAWISFSSLDIAESRKAYQLAINALEERRDDITFAYHWGKYVPVNTEWAKKSHGQALNDWKRQREILLPTREMRYLFSNDFTDSLGVTLE